MSGSVFGRRNIGDQVPLIASGIEAGLKLREKLRYGRGNEIQAIKFYAFSYLVICVGGFGGVGVRINGASPSAVFNNKALREWW